jgi:energy-coupling factor transport system substrate-specific component
MSGSGTQMSKALWVVAFIVAALFIAFVLYIGFDILSKGLDKSSEWLITQPFVVLGRDTWFIIAGILWVLGTALFIMELLGWTIRGGRIVRQVIRWDPIDVSIVALTAAVYGGALAATGGIPIIPGFTWVRPANALAPIFGVLFGLPGALGVAIGNFIADALAGYLSIGSVGGFVGNFIIAYVPYKLMRDQSFRTPRSIIEFYIWGALINNIWCSLYISWWLDALEPVIGLSRPFVWGWFAPFVIFNNVFICSILSPILGYILYPPIKARGLHWSDRIEIVSKTR